jgi:hypothetical protein
MSNDMTPREMKMRIAELESAARGVLDWADLALTRPDEFDSHGVRNLDGPAFDALREAMDK